MTIDEQEIARLDAFAQWCRERADDPAFTTEQAILWKCTSNSVRSAARSFRAINEWEVKKAKKA